MAWTAARTWVSEEIVTAAIMNTHVRDNLVYLKGQAGAIATEDAVEFAGNLTFTSTQTVDGVDVSVHDPATTDVHAAVSGTNTVALIVATTYTGNGSGASRTIALSFAPKIVLLDDTVSGGENNSWIMLGGGASIRHPIDVIADGTGDAHARSSQVAISGNGFTVGGADNEGNVDTRVYHYVAIG